MNTITAITGHAKTGKTYFANHLDIEKKLLSLDIYGDNSIKGAVLRVDVTRNMRGCMEKVVQQLVTSDVVNRYSTIIFDGFNHILSSVRKEYEKLYGNRCKKDFDVDFDYNHTINFLVKDQFIKWFEVLLYQVYDIVLILDDSFIDINWIYSDIKAFFMMTDWCSWNTVNIFLHTDYNGEVVKRMINYNGNIEEMNSFLYTYTEKLNE